MKFTLSLTSLLLSSALLAQDSGNLSSYHLGYSSNDLSYNESQGGFYNSIDFFNTSASGLGIGIGADLNIWNSSSNTYTRKTTMFSMGGMLKMGYTFQNRFNIPLRLKAGVGYGVIKSVDDSGWGMQYDAGGEYLVYRSLGVGVKYKYAEADLMGEKFTNKSTIFSMLFAF
jgi:hypothetical protein